MSESPAAAAEPAPGAATPAGEAFTEARVTFSRADLATMGLAELGETLEAAGCRHAEVVDADAGVAVLEIHVATPLDPTRLEALPPVDRWAPVDGTSGYLLELRASAFPPCLAASAPDPVRCPSAELSGSTLSMSLVGPRDAIAGVLGACEDAGLDPVLDRLGDYRPTDPTLSALTDRQREVLQTAYRLGYFEVPRSVGVEDVAAELDIGASTVVEHLRRAQRNLLAGHFETASG